MIQKPPSRCRAGPWIGMAGAGVVGRGEVFSDITGELFAHPMAASTIRRAQRVDGVAAAIGVVSGNVQLLARDGHVIGVRAPLGRSTDPSFADSLRAGRVPTAPDEVVIDQTTADDQGFGVGDQVRILPSEVHGVAGVGEQELRDRAAAALGPGYQAFTETALATERARNATPTEGGDSQFFLVAGVVALFAGMFLIRNTFSIILASRTRELALLRCVGASRAQLRSSVLLEAAILGAVASLAGLAAGVGLAWGLGALLRSTDEALADVTGSLRILPRTVLVGLAVGVGTTVVSAWSPTRRATRVAPVTALRGDVFTLDRRESRARGGSSAGSLVATPRAAPAAPPRPRSRW